MSDAMNTFAGSFTSLRNLVASASCAVVLAACGGSDDAPVPPEAAAVAPAITAQPAAATVTEGATASFSVAATGTAPLTYQWQRNGSTIAGATAATYALVTALGDDNAQFRVVVTNSAGSVTSNAAALRVNARPRPPALTAQPMSMSIAELNSVTLSVTVDGTPPFTYQWQRSPDGATYADIAAATAESYTTPLLSRADSGVRYRVIVNNATGTAVTSAAAQITVNADAAVLAAAGGVVSGDNDAIRVTVPAGALLGPTRFQFARATAPVTPPANYELIAGAAYDIETTGPGFATGSTVRIDIRALVPPAPVAIAKAGASGSEGERVGRLNSGQFQSAVVQCAQSTSPLVTPVNPDGSINTALCSPTTANRPASTNVTPVAPQPAVLPIITVQPQSASVVIGQTGGFSVVATGPNLVYQWTRNGAVVGNGREITVPNVSAADNGSTFRVRVSNQFGFVLSNVVTLNVGPPPKPAPSVWSAPATSLPLGALSELPQAAVDVLAAAINDNGTLRLLDLDPAFSYTPITGIAGRPRVASAGEARTIVLYFDNTSGSTCGPFGGNRLNAIVLQRGSEGGQWLSPSFVVYTAPSGCLLQVAADISARGASFALARGTGEVIMGSANRTYSPVAQAWGAPQVQTAPLTTGGGCDGIPTFSERGLSGTPRGLTLGNRAAVFAYETQSANTCVATMDAAGVWSGAQVLWSNGALSAGNGNVVTALDANGNAAVISNRLVSTVHQVQPAYLPAGTTTWQVESLLTPAFGPLLPDLAFDGLGNLLVAWRAQPQAGATFTTLYAARRTSAGWQPSERLDPADVDTRFPRVTMNSNGIAYVTWQALDAGLFRVKGAQLGPFAQWGDAEWIQPAGGNDARFAVAPRYFDEAPSGNDRLRGLPLYWRETDTNGNARIVRSVRQ
jgi:hypothetical protein